MDRKILFLIIAFSIFVLLGLNSIPETEIPEAIVDQTNYNITLGYIVTTNSSLPKDEFLISIAEKDINEYCLRNEIPWQFHFTVKCAEGQAQKAHDFTQEFAENGIKLAGGYGWSSFLCSGARKIAQENNMTLISISSTSPIMAIPDTAFRLCPTDLKQVEPIIAMMNDFEASSVIIIQRGDAWGDGIVDDFESKYNGQILRKIRYPGETIEFKHQLEIAEAAFTEYNETEKPNMLLVTFSEASYILNDAKVYPVLLNTTWFGTDCIADDRSILEEAGEYASQVKLISPKISVNQENVDYLEINQLYEEKFGSDMDFYQANVYDCCWLMAHCIIDLNTTDGVAIQSSILEVASKHQGITGDLSLDSNGDREIASYALYGYFNVNDTYVSEKCGFYQQDTDQIIWDNNYLYLESGN